MGFSKGVAINLQKRSMSVEDARCRFSISCTMCCNDPKCLWQSSCDRCEVAATHRRIVAELRARGVMNNANKVAIG